MFVNWAGLTYAETRRLRAALLAEHSKAYANKIMIAVRGVLEEAQLMANQQYRQLATRLGREDRLDLAERKTALVESLAEAVKELKMEKIQRQEDDIHGRALKQGEITAIVEVCAQDESYGGYRNAALFLVGCACGPRRTEIVNLDLADFSQDSDGEGSLIVRHGKGDKSRKIPVNDGALDALLDWLSVRGEEPGPLFVAVNKGGRLALGERMTSQAIFNTCQTLAQDAKIRPFGPHDMRRTCATELIERGADLSTVAKILGHESIETTALYRRDLERAKRKAVNLLHFPYTRRRLAIP